MMDDSKIFSEIIKERIIKTLENKNYTVTENEDGSIQGLRYQRRVLIKKNFILYCMISNDEEILFNGHIKTSTEFDIIDDATNNYSDWLN